MPRNHAIMSTLQKIETLDEYKRIQGNGDRCSLLELADLAKGKFLLQELSSKATIARIIRN